MTNNELSRKVLDTLKAGSGSARFNHLVDSLGVDARAVFKNLFFLEEKGFVQLSTSYSTDSVYPQILLARMREAGEELLSDPERLDKVFPLSDTADIKPDIPPDIASIGMTFEQALELLAVKARDEMKGDERDSALEKIEWLLSLPFVKEPMKFEGR